ncbi:MAG: hypothetical protein LBS96_03280 [Oscillospiraceae bacterium]|jgi:hypothetical protein|nr:hypothetical protein [Oscillospiraceae bacterium]
MRNTRCTQHIRCSRCRYKQHDPTASQPGWRAIECGNPCSDCYKALLNVSPTGDMQSRVTWRGCPLGREARM